MKTKKFSSDEKKAGKIKKCLQTEYTVDKKKNVRLIPSILTPNNLICYWLINCVLIGCSHLNNGCSLSKHTPFKKYTIFYGTDCELN